MLSSRIASLDILRGLVMAIMVLDHVRDYVGLGFIYTNPTDLQTTTSALFFTRWVTHFCAPVFVFLAGTSAYLFGKKYPSRKGLAWFLFSRGIFFILLEFTIINFGWTFDPTFSAHIIQVIWAIGCSMICLSALVFLKLRWIAILGLCIVFGHNLLDQVHPEDTNKLFWYLLHQDAFIHTTQGNIWILPYPILPWLGIMLCGFAMGHWYRPGFSVARRQQCLFAAGSAAIILFIVLRTLHLYGDPLPWEAESTHPLLSFLNCTKYPPSLQFTLMTLGPALLALAFMDMIGTAKLRFLTIFGRVPLFFYVLHLYLVHLIALLILVASGRDWTQMIITAKNLDSMQLQNYGYGLPAVYLVWILVLVLLYFPCKWYGEYRLEHKNRKWLSYL